MNAGTLYIDVNQEGELVVSKENLEMSEVIAILGNVYINSCKNANYTPRDIDKLTDLIIREKYQIPIKKIKKRDKK